MSVTVHDPRLFGPMDFRDMRPEVFPALDNHDAYVLPDLLKVKAAVAKLGLQHDIEVIPLVGSLFQIVPFSGATELGSDEVIRVWINVGALTETTKPSFSEVLWHELGHAVDYERRELTRATYEEHMAEVNAQYDVAFANQNRYPTYEEWLHSEYLNLPGERFAQEFAERYADRYKLSR